MVSIRGLNVFGIVLVYGFSRGCLRKSSLLQSSGGAQREKGDGNGWHQEGVEKSIRRQKLGHGSSKRRFGRRR
jgi:hypothetical protein